MIKKKCEDKIKHFKKKQLRISVIARETMDYIEMSVKIKENFFISYIQNENKPS